MMPQQGADHLCSEGRDRNRLVVSVHVEHCLVVAVCANDPQRAQDSVDVSPVKAVLLRPGCLASGSLDFEPKQVNDVLLLKNVYRWGLGSALSACPNNCKKMPPRRASGLSQFRLEDFWFQLSRRFRSATCPFPSFYCWPLRWRTRKLNELAALARAIKENSGKRARWVSGKQARWAGSSAAALT